MKTKIIIGVLLITLMLPIAYAEIASESNEEIKDVETETLPGVNPDSPFYWIDRAIEKLQITFASDSVKKAELRMKFAKERRAEFKAMAEKGKLDKAEAALDDYDNELADASRNAEDARGIGKNVSQLAKDVDDMYEKHLLVLRLVRAKAPEQAWSGLDKAIENAQQKLEQKSAEKEDKKTKEEKTENEASDSDDDEPDDDNTKKNKTK